MDLVYWDLTPQRQPGSYQGDDDDDDDDEISFLVEETGVPGGNHRPAASIWIVCEDNCVRWFFTELV